MQSQEPENKPKTRGLAVEIAVMAVLFLAAIAGVQALQGLQGGNHRPQFNPFGAIFLPR